MGFYKLESSRQSEKEIMTMVTHTFLANYFQINYMSRTTITDNPATKTAVTRPLIQCNRNAELIHL